MSFDHTGVFIYMEKIIRSVIDVIRDSLCKTDYFEITSSNFEISIMASPFVTPAFEENPNIVRDGTDVSNSSNRLIGAIDISGSMSGQRMRSISQVLHELCIGDNSLSFENFFTWTDSAQLTQGPNLRIRGQSYGSFDVLNKNNAVLRQVRLAVTQIPTVSFRSHSSTI